MSRIVVTEFMDERAVVKLAAKHDVLYDPKLVDDAARLHAEGAGADAIVVRNRTQVRGELLAALAKCRVVGRLGVGLDNIDVTACEARDIKVIPAIGANALSVAEYVIATAMLLRGAYQSTGEVVAGQWPRNALSNGREIGGKTLGLVGFGSIGQLTAKLAQGAAALKSGHLGGAALDVFEAEPMPAGGAFAGCPNLVLTPHIAGVSAESNERVSFMIAQCVLEELA